MPDILQFYANSADVAPGKGTGESLESDASIYAELRKIKHWRRILALREKEEEFQDVLRKTGSAQLWKGIPKKPSVRQEDLETLRTELGKPKDVEQRIVQPAAEMSDASKPKTKSRAKKTPPLAQEGSVTNIPEGSVAVMEQEVIAPGPSGPIEEQPKEDSSTIRFCPVCRYYLYLQAASDLSKGGEAINVRLCRNCGFKEEDKKGGLVSEILVKERSAEGYKILLNEFTTRDFRLPHIRGSLKCPSAICDTNTKGVESDIIYLKDDQVNLTYLYICNHCNTQWRSRR
jgi:hypothetical protein